MREMEQKDLVIKFNHLYKVVDVRLYVRTKMGLVMLTDILLSDENWEIIKEHIDAEYICLDKQEQVVYNTTNEGSGDG